MSLLIFFGQSVATTAVSQDLSAAYAVHRPKSNPSLVGNPATGGIRTARAGAVDTITSVQSDKAASYQVFNSVQSDKAASYGIAGAVDSSLVASYAIGNVVFADRAAAYTVLQSLNIDLAASFAVVAAVNKDLSGAYGLSGSVAKDFVAAYSIVIEPGKNLLLAGGKKAAIARRALRAADATSNTSVANTLPAAYQVFAYVAADKVAAYNVAPGLTARRNSRLLGNSKYAAARRVAAADSGVSSTLTAAYFVNGGVSADLVAAYALFAGQPFKDLPSTYRVYGWTRNQPLLGTDIPEHRRVTRLHDTVPFDGTASQEFTAVYQTTSSVQRGATAAYQVLSGVQVDLTSSYQLRTSASQDFSSNYNIAQYVANDLTGSYFTPGGVVSDLAGGYSMAGAVPADLPAAYAIKSRVSKDLSGAFAAAAFVYRDFFATYPVGLVYAAASADDIIVPLHSSEMLVAADITMTVVPPHTETMVMPPGGNEGIV